MKLEVKKGIELEVCNYYYRDYPEDDWSIIIIEDSIEKCIEKFWKEHYINSDINIERTYFSKVDYVNYKSKKVKLEEQHFDNDLSKLYTSQFYDSEFKDFATSERKRINEERLKREEEEREQEKTKSELATLQKLKEKYEQ